MEHLSLPFDDVVHFKYSSKPESGPAFYRGTFQLASVGDSYFDMRGWGKGLVWVNGHNLGRYWRIGPQQSLFVPSIWLKNGRNEIVVLDLEDGGNRSILGRKDPVWETPKVK